MSNVTSNVCEVTPLNFYGPPSASQVRMDAQIRKNKCKTRLSMTTPTIFNLFGPSRTWKVFKKQADALLFASQKRNGLMPFCFEQASGERLFLVAHPCLFWYVDAPRETKDRNSYEIIVENTVSKLYLDIEFATDLNPGRDGNRMLRNFLKVINTTLKERFGVVCCNEKTDFLDLESVYTDKFSHHIIYPNVAFENNAHVGSFVKDVCSTLKSAFAQGKSAVEVQAEKYEITPEELLEFFVKEKKGNTTLFCDEGVYTKNRHFRAYQSTKHGKNSPMLFCASNTYIPSPPPLYDYHLQIFLDSLITYFPDEAPNILSVPHLKIKYPAAPKCGPVEVDKTIFSDLDSFLYGLISPKGNIRKKYYYHSSNLIVYEIGNYRYCHNINREHKSNNVKIVFDMNRFEYYQTCYDPECWLYRSESVPIPENIRLLYEDESLLLSLCNNNDDYFKDDHHFCTFLKDLEQTDDYLPIVGLLDDEYTQAFTNVRDGG